MNNCTILTNKRLTVKSKIIITLILCIFTLNGFSQKKIREYEVRYSNILKVIESEDYQTALDTLLTLDSIPLEKLIEDINSSAEIRNANVAKYQIKREIAECYSKIVGMENSAIPFYEAILNSDYSKDIILNSRLIADAYYNNYDFKKAISYYNNARNIASSPQIHQQIDWKIQNCKQGIEIIHKDTSAAITHRLNEELNSKIYSEISPYITSDGKRMFFIRIEKTFFAGNERKVAHVMTSKKETNNNWSEAVEIQLTAPPSDDSTHIDLAGISPNASSIYILSKFNNNVDIYYYELNGNVATQMRPLDNQINTPFDEGKLCFNADSTILFFSSARPGSYGQKDIYKAQRMANGDWGTVQTLGARLNSRYDEDAPFYIDKIQKLYFASEDHSMGKHDIVFSTFKSNDWSYPQNIGFPYNTINDNVSFTLTSDETEAYFSAKVSATDDLYDIFYADIRSNIAYTLIKGKISEGIPRNPMSTSLYVLDRITGETQHYVYDTRYKLGHYLLLLKPGRYYDMIICDANKSYLNQYITVFVPRQPNFFNLFQTVEMKPLTLLDKKIGESVEITNTMFDFYTIVDLKEIEKSEQTNYYDHLLKLMRDIMQHTDIQLALTKIDELVKPEVPEGGYVELLDLVREAIETTDTVKLNLLCNNAPKSGTQVHQFVYSENFKITDLEEIEVNGSKFRIAPRYFTEPVYNNDELRTIISENLIGNNLLIPKRETEFSKEDVENKDNRTNLSDLVLYTFYFKEDKSDIQRKAMNEIELVAEFLVNQYPSDIEIIAYFDGKEYNPAHSLSEERMNQIITKFSGFGVNSSRFKKQYKLGSGSNSDENRKVEIRLSNESTWLK